MDLELRRKRKRIGRTYSNAKLFTQRSIVLCLSFLIFVLFISSGRWFSIGAASFRPVLTASSTTLSRLSSSASKSILDSLNSKFSALKIESRVLFPDHVLFVVSNKFRQNERLQCFYAKSSLNGTDSEVLKRPALSKDSYDDFRSIARCPHPPLNYSVAAVELRRRGAAAVNYELPRNNQTVHSWDKVVYEAVLDGDTVVVFAKGLNLRPHKESNPAQFSCHFDLGHSDKDTGYVLTSAAVAAAQEVVRCSLPQSLLNNLDKVQGIRVTIGHASANTKASPLRETLPSVARIFSSKSNEKTRNHKKHEVCACTMVWNQAPAIREWIMYHSWLGVERWFIYDNNSDDEIDEVIKELDMQEFNVSRVTWPWIKTQEAGFSHCALRARDECNWVGFFDVDEYFYFPFKYRLQQEHGVAGRNALGSLISNLSSLDTVAEIRTACHSFGPSGLTSPPSRGVTFGYTCRLQSPERHKSFVRPDSLDASLLNVVHHFKLKEGFKYLNVPEGSVIVNHYKYQVWETFRAKFFRRVATYVVDWKEDQNKGSKDRAPGLGTEAIEPPNWRLQFCEVWDTGLRDYVLTHLSDPLTGSLPWERTLF